MFTDVSSLNLQYSRVDTPGNLTFESLILRPHWFVNVDARRIAFINVDWNWGSLKGDVRTLLKMTVSSPHRLLAIAYRHLAVNAEENHRYEDASRFRYRAMDAPRREKWRGAAFWRLSWWYWLASGYGERVWQAALVLVILWFMFASVFFIGQQSGQWWRPTQTQLQETSLATTTKASAEMPRLTGFRDSLVYSAGVMTLQKPEPLPANKRARTLVLLETILGPVQAALLALAIRRKFMR